MPKKESKKNTPQDERIAVCQKYIDEYFALKEKNRNKGGRESGYDAEYHCPLVIKIVSEKKRLSAFCKVAKIGDSTFHRWRQKYPEFEECYRYALMCARETWESIGEEGHYNLDFNYKVWEKQGQMWFGLGAANKVRISKGDTPLEQYSHICEQAEQGEFTSSEFKQICEAVNIGLRAHEVIGLQTEVDELKRLLQIMAENNGENIRPIETAKKTN